MQSDFIYAKPHGTQLSRISSQALHINKQKYRRV